MNTTLKKIMVATKETTQLVISVSAGITAGVGIHKSNPLGLDEAPNVVASTAVAVVVADTVDDLCDFVTDIVSVGCDKVKELLSKKEPSEEVDSAE